MQILENDWQRNINFYFQITENKKKKENKRTILPHIQRDKSMLIVVVDSYNDSNHSYE